MRCGGGAVVATGGELVGERLVGDEAACFRPLDGPVERGSRGLEIALGACAFAFDEVDAMSEVVGAVLGERRHRREALGGAIAEGGAGFGGKGPDGERGVLMEHRHVPGRDDAVEIRAGGLEQRARVGRRAEVVTGDAGQQSHDAERAPRAIGFGGCERGAFVECVPIETRGVGQPAGERAQQLLERRVDVQRVDLLEPAHHASEFERVGEQRLEVLAGVERVVDPRMRRVRRVLEIARLAADGDGAAQLVERTSQWHGERAHEIVHDVHGARDERAVVEPLQQRQRHLTPGVRLAEHSQAVEHDAVDRERVRRRR